MFIGFMNALVTNWQSSNSTCHDLCLEVMMLRNLCNISLLTAMWASDVSLTEVTVEGTVYKLCFCYHLVVKVSHWSLLDVRETTEKYLSARRGQCSDALFTGTTRGQKRQGFVVIIPLIPIISDLLKVNVFCHHMKNKGCLWIISVVLTGHRSFFLLSGYLQNSKFPWWKFNVTAIFFVKCCLLTSC